jgi:hypothetical protein
LPFYFLLLPYSEGGTTMSYGGTPNIGQLAQGMTGAAEAVLAAVQSGMAYLPNGAAVVSSVVQLTTATRSFRDNVMANQPPGVIMNLFDQLDGLAGQLDQYFMANQTSPQIQSAWQTFADLEVQTGQVCRGGQVQQGFNPNTSPPVGPSPVAGLADQLANETNTFIANFMPTAGRVPEGRFMLAEAQQLQVAATSFCQSVYANLPPAQLAQQFANVNACWQQLGGRVQRIARGHVGPNIAQVQKLGIICSQIGQTLGMPGY